MSVEIPTGKLPAPLLREILEPLAPWPAEVRVGPTVGEDAAAIDVPDGVLVVAADPITLTGSEVGAYAVVINANDVAVTGARPRWFLATVLLPPGTTTDDVRALFAEMWTACKEAGVALVGGHAEVTAAVLQPVVSGQMLGLVAADELVTTSGARPGDVLVQIGPAPVEGAAVFAAEAADSLGGLDAEVVRAASEATRTPGISVVEPALSAARLGATAMHDPTEGGLAAGLAELAEASGIRIVVDRDAVVWFGPGVAVCEALGADPWATLASGCVLATFPARQEEDVLAEVSRSYEVAVIGRVEEGDGVVDIHGEPIAWPERDEIARILG
jgi:hydrogenase expression/formation protein HypE